jgi:hypothetical protein
MTRVQQMQAWENSSSKQGLIVDFLRCSNLIWRNNDSGMALF